MIYPSCKSKVSMPKTITDRQTVLGTAVSCSLLHLGSAVPISFPEHHPPTLRSPTSQQNYLKFQLCWSNSHDKDMTRTGSVVNLK